MFFAMETQIPVLNVGGSSPFGCMKKECRCQWHLHSFFITHRKGLELLSRGAAAS